MVPLPRFAGAEKFYLEQQQRVRFNSMHVSLRGGLRHDPQTSIRQIPALFAQSESEDWQAAQSRHLRPARRSREARARRAVFQAALNPPQRRNVVARMERSEIR